MTPNGLHPILEAAAQGDLPDWAVVRPERRRHLASVAGLMERWATDLGLDADDRARWSAAAWLHDALRDADPDGLVEEAGEYPAPLRHGPAVAVRLSEAGVDDPELLDAVAFHTLGRSGIGRLGRFLYLADYLDPLRPFEPARRAALRSRLPGAEPEVLRKVVARRIGELVCRGLPLRPETVGFWNEVSEGR